MKKLFLTLFVCALSNSLFYAQLKVSPNGNVGIQVGDGTPLSALSIDTLGNSTTGLFVLGNNTGISAYRKGSANNYWTYAINAFSELQSYYAVGIKGETYSSTPSGSGRAWGVYGKAGNATSGFNYGVFGSLSGSNNGAGIVGTINGNEDVSVPGKYAGYFVGDVKVTGTITGNSIVNSDKRYKKNITELNAATTLDNVLKMSPVKYNLKQMYTEVKGDTVKAKQRLYDEKSQLFQKEQYGLIAQDLQKLYPELVYEDASGYLSINYVGLIPLLIKSIQELNAKVESLKSLNNKLYSVKDTLNNPLRSSGAEIAKLYQNAPNPFSEGTEIKYYLPADIVSASLCVYDMQGKQLKRINITQRGNGSVYIYASEFSAGIYLYGLIADGQEIDIKRMVLTD